MRRLIHIAVSFDEVTWKVSYTCGISDEVEQLWLAGGGDMPNVLKFEDPDALKSPEIQGPHEAVQQASHLVLSQVIPQP